jgi:UDP-galactose transporter B1
VCAAGIFLSYLLYGYLQEWLVETRFDEAEAGDARFTFVSFALFWQCLTNTGMALLAIAPRREWPWQGSPSPPPKTFFWLACAYVGSMSCSNRAVLLTSYPVQQITKACKPIPVLVSGLFGKGKLHQRALGRCTAVGVGSVALVTGGVSVFMYINALETRHAPADGGRHKASDPPAMAAWLTGVALLLASLVLDGVTGHLQEVLIGTHYAGQKKRELSGWHMMFWTNAPSTVLMLVAALATGEFGRALAFWWQHPVTIVLVLGNGVVSSVGQAFVFATITRFSSLTCSIITCSRKFTTILLSIVLFGHHISFVQWLAIVSVFSGVSLEFFQASTHKQPPKQQT